MVFTITVTANGKKGMGSVIRNFSGYARKIPIAGRNGVWLFTNRLASEIRKEALARGHKTTGYLSSERGTFAKKMDKNVWVVKMPFYTKYLEAGATRARGIPPVRKVRIWEKKHGRKLAGLKRTRAHPFTASVITREVKRQLRKTVERQINHAIKNTAR